jgi:hypothetical protein
MSYFIAQDPNSDHAIGFEANDREEANRLLEQSLFSTYAIVWTTEGTLHLNRVKYDRASLR